MPVGREDDPDRALAEALARGESDALIELMRRHGPWVRGVVFAACGDASAVADIEQEVWLRCWRRARTLDDAGRWRSWLYALAYHAAVDYARRARRRRRHLAVLAERPAAARSGPDPAEQAARRERHQRALRAVVSLPETYRVPFVLRHLGGWSYRQIAEATGLPVATVETRLVRARRRLRAMLLSGAEP